MEGTNISNNGSIERVFHLPLLSSLLDIALLVINKHSQQISSYNPSFVWSTFTLIQKVFKNELCLWKLCFCGSRLQKFSFNVVKIVLYPFYPNKPNIKESLVKPVLAPNQTFAKFQILEKQFKQNLF